ncbi:hypothetical protein [Picosynechococcus sp. PCC 8807]|uniref:hypothetical protein n=1 Tax=Picosynechococcus sp. PCC 8807 TaxID=195248 RepID=UPI000810D7B1|nr:hypothetical protein [Picosynechococcus sp. PCC 8807]ANV92020.1 hypothetical protein AWQ24_14670 [Picosynechococcus sp. PCC 8807]
MIALPFEIGYGNFTVRISQGKYSYRWEILSLEKKVLLDFGHEERTERAIAEAFDVLDEIINSSSLMG